jgi:type IV pilus assembly protein PilO
MKILDQFGKQPLAIKLAVLAIVLIGIAGAEYQVFFVPKRDEFRALKKKSDELKAKLVENQAVADNLSKFQEEVNILNEQLKQAVALLPNEADIHTIFRNLSIVAKKTNVDLLSFRPGGQGSHGFYNDISMDIRLEGTYHDIATFIDQVGKLPRIMNVSNIVFSAPKVTGNIILLNVDCRVTTFMFAGGGAKS